MTEGVGWSSSMRGTLAPSAEVSLISIKFPYEIG